MSQEQMILDTFEMVRFMHDNMVTKSELKSELKAELQYFPTKKELKDELQHFATKKELKEELRDFATKRDLERFATKQELETLKSDLITHIDGFVVLHQKLDIELVALRAKYQRLESYIFQLANRVRVRLE